MIQFINQLIETPAPKAQKWDLDQFIMPSTQWGQDADAYVRELRDHDRI